MDVIKYGLAEAICSYTDKKRIRRIGFIGTGPMSKWFVPYFKEEGYEVFLTGRTTILRPEEMIPKVDVVSPCVPISATRSVLKQYGKYLKSGQALIIFCGEITNTINAALENTSDGVEVMVVHNLWGPLATNMEGKNAVITKTERSGKLCEEFERIFHKYCTNVVYTSPEKHDLMMDIVQNVPTALSIAYASIIMKYGKEHGITPDDIINYSTLTSVYPILHMTRVHGQSHRTYAEILASNRKNTKILRRFRDELNEIIKLCDRGDIEELERMMRNNTDGFLSKKGFLKEMLRLSLEADSVLSKPKKTRM